MAKSTKEQIKNRMVKTAAELWGVAAKEIETSFDPIIALLLSACAAEIEKISAELDESETRITEKLIELMTPEKSIGPSPAHAILHAEPIDNVTNINHEYHFTIRKEIPQQKTSIQYKDVSFTPLQDFNLIDAKIEYLISGSSCIELGDKRNQKVLGKSLDGSPLPDASMYLGLSGLSIKTFKDVSVYFDFLGTSRSNKELFYNHLRNSKWSLNGNAIETKGGFFNSENEQEIFVGNIFEEVSDKSDLAHQEILRFYKHHYVTVRSAELKKEHFVPFQELSDFLSQNKLKTAGNTLWIKIEFPTVVSNELLGTIFCSLNAFPVMNRELQSFTYQLKDYVNIIPLNTENLFFDVKSITNTQGKKYNTKSSNIAKSDKGTYMIRSSNMGSLEQRKAKDYIVYLLELLKDESASFSFLNNDFLLKSLKSLNQQIAVLEKKVGDSTIDESQTHYAVLRPYSANDQLVVEFWTSNGNIANNIKSDSDLYLNKGIGVKQSNIYFLTTSSGGKSNLNLTDRLNSYRSALFSRDRIVTKEDIRILCYEIYGKRLKKVEIKKTYIKDLDLNKGWIPGIQILLTPTRKTTEEDWKHENNKLRFLLEKKSLNIFPYSLKILN